MSATTTRSTRHRPGQRARACSHFQATTSGATDARLLADGRWVYRTLYDCPTCGMSFTEQHVQAAARP